VAAAVTAAAPEVASLATAAATVAAAAPRVREAGSLTVGPVQLQTIMEALSDAARCHDHHGGPPTVAAASRRVWRRLSTRLAAVPEPDPPGLAEAGETGPGGDALASVRALGGNEWIWLLAWLHDAAPGLVASALAALAEDRRERAEAARKRRNRKATLRDRRRRQGAA
jgi:hypothetical protein